MDLRLSGRPALVAAASRGLGKACAMSLAEEGASVAICGRDRGAVEAARDEIADATGANVVAITADVSMEKDASRFVREGTEALGGCQILVANAGGPPLGRFDEVTDDHWRTAIDLNLLSTIWMTREAIPGMREAGYGRIIVIASLTVKQPISEALLSNSIRAAVIALARSLVDDVGPDGITVNAVLPGRVWTERVRELMQHQAGQLGRTLEEHRAAVAGGIPLRRLGEPAELGDLVTFLASDRAGYLTGCFIQVDGGMYRGLL